MGPEQSLAPRAWLGWSQTKLASHTNVSLSTVRDFETGPRTLITNNIAAMRRAIEMGGILLMFGETGEAVSCGKPRNAGGPVAREMRASASL